MKSTTKSVGFPLIEWYETDRNIHINACYFCEWLILITPSENCTQNSNKNVKFITLIRNLKLYL